MNFKQNLYQIKKLYFLLLVFFLATTINLNGVPAYPHPVEFEQPDGSVVTIQLKGDEKVSWAETPDGYTILVTKEGYYEYAVIDKNGDLAFSGTKVSSVEKRSAEEQNLLKEIPKGLRYSERQIEKMKSVWEMKEERSQKSFPTTGEQTMLCILMETPDVPFTKTQADFDALFNQLNYTVGGATGSVKDYYLENSYGQFELTVDVVGPYTAEHDMEHYGSTWEGARELASDVILKANFLIYEYTITAEPNNPDYGSVTGQDEYEHGEEVTLIATPVEDYRFVNWVEHDTPVEDADTEHAFTATSDRDLIAVFAYNRFNVTFIVEDKDGDEISNAFITLDEETNELGDYVFEEIEPGSYDYSISAEDYFDETGTVNVFEDHVTKSVTMSIDDTYVEAHAETQLSIFPNPARDKFTIESNEIIKQIKLIDVSGQVIKLITVDGLRVELNVNDLRPEMYFMQIFTEDGVVTQRVQVTR